MESMKSKIAAMMLMGAMMEAPTIQRIRKGTSKTQLSTKQKNKRVKSKAAKQARKKNR